MTDFEVELVDERNARWESSSAKFWATFYTDQGESHATETYELRGVTFSDAREWVLNVARSRPWTLSLVVSDDAHGMGLVLLEGEDPNDLSSVSPEIS